MTIRPSIFALLLLASTVSAAAAAPRTDGAYRLERSDGSWTGSISLDSVSGGHLYITGTGRADSIALGDVASIRRERTSHVIGGLVGLVGGTLAGVGIGSGVYLLTGPGDHGNWAPAIYAFGAACASIIAGTVWGANEGLPVYPVDDLTLDGLNNEQRAAALARFILDERLRAGEP